MNILTPLPCTSLPGCRAYLRITFVLCRWLSFIFMGGVCASVTWGHLLLKAALTNVAQIESRCCLSILLWKRGARLHYRTLEGRDSVFQGWESALCQAGCWKQRIQRWNTNGTLPQALSLVGERDQGQRGKIGWKKDHCTKVWYLKERSPECSGTEWRRLGWVWPENGL